VLQEIQEGDVRRYFDAPIEIASQGRMVMWWIWEKGRILEYFTDGIIFPAENIIFRAMAFIESFRAAG